MGGEVLDVEKALLLELVVVVFVLVALMPTRRAGLRDEGGLLLRCRRVLVGHVVLFSLSLVFWDLLLFRGPQRAYVTYILRKCTIPKTQQIAHAKKSRTESLRR